jgi:hypothetical protein
MRPLMFWGNNYSVWYAKFLWYYVGPDFGWLSFFAFRGHPIVQWKTRMKSQRKRQLRESITHNKTQEDIEEERSWGTTIMYFQKWKGKVILVWILFVKDLKLFLTSQCLCNVEFVMGIDICVCVCVCVCLLSLKHPTCLIKCLIDLHFIAVMLFYVPKCEALECN